jgi:type VI secretion system secreted protein VgrG
MKDASITEYQRDAALLGTRGRDHFAEHALSQLRSDRITAQGESDCRRLAPGYRFNLAQHPIDPLNTEYVVTGVRSTGYAPDHAPAGCPHLYRCSFECVPASMGE